MRYLVEGIVERVHGSGGGDLDREDRLLVVDPLGGRRRLLRRTLPDVG